MPLTKERKSELIEQYVNWLRECSAVIMAEFPGVPAQNLYGLRTRLREHGQLHVVKLTLFARALADAGLPVPENMTGSLIMAFAKDEPPVVARTMMDFARDVKEFNVRGGLLGSRLLDAEGVKSLAELPPKPIILAGLLGTIQAPMSQLINVLNAPMRELVQVLKARSEQGQAGAAA